MVIVRNNFVLYLCLFSSYELLLLYKDLSHWTSWNDFPKVLNLTAKSLKVNIVIFHMNKAILYTNEVNLITSETL